MNPVQRTPSRRDVLRAGASAVAASAAAVYLRPAAASAWPDRPIRIVVPYAAGQGADVLTRLLAKELQVTLNQPFVVENRAGAGGNIGAQMAARAPGDGYTFMLGTNATNAANEFLYSNLGYDPAADFKSVAMIGMLPMVICSASPDFPTNGVAELIARARAKPDSINVGLPSTTAQVVFAQFAKQAQAPLFGIKYKASAQSMNDVLGGQIPLVIDTVTASRAHIAAGKLHALGITSLKSSEMLPGVNPVSEQGVAGFDVVAWDAFFAPHGTPDDVIRIFSEHVHRAMQKPALRSRMMDIGVEPLSMSPAQLDAFVKTERSKWGGVIQAAGLRID